MIFLSFLVILYLGIWPSTRAAKDTQNFASCPSKTRFETSFSYPHAVLKEKTFEDESDECKHTNDFTKVVEAILHSSARGHYRVHSSLLQELIIRGFQTLCLWTRPLKDKIKFKSHLKESNQSFKISHIPSETKYHFVNVNNITVYQWPVQNETLTTDPTDSRCPSDSFTTMYRASSNTTTICGSLRINDTSTTEFILTYRDVRIKVNEKKTRTLKGRILGTPIREEFTFENCTLRSTALPLPFDFVLDVLNPRLIEEIFRGDPTARLRYASLKHDAKIAEIYQQNVLRIISKLLIQFVASEYSTPYQFLSNSSITSNDIDELTITGLNKSQTCTSNMRITVRENHLLMRLLFSFNFPDKSNNTVVVIEPASHLPRLSALIKKIIVRLEFSSPIEADDNFNLVDVRVQLVEKYPSTTFQKYASSVNNALSQIIQRIVLTLILYETN